MPRGGTSPKTTLSQGELGAVVERVRREGGVAVSALKLGKLARAAELELLEAASKAGLEHTGKAIRVPLDAQVRRALTEAGEVGVAPAALGKRVRGARTAAELALVIRGLVDAGVVALCVAGRGSKLVLRSATVLAEPELDALAEVARVLAEAAKKTKPQRGKPRPTLERAAIAPASKRLASLLGPSAPEQSATELAVAAALRVAQAEGGLVHVPSLVRALEPLRPRDACVAALEAHARAGAIELRPDGAIGRMADDDRARCPRAPDGTPLSYARLREGAHG